jgi:hypothetical protein
VVGGFSLKLSHVILIYFAAGHSNDNNRRELRRPMGGDDELARGMGRMDPFSKSLLINKQKNS